MSVPFQDPAREYRALREELDEALLRVAGSGRYVLGEEVEALERELAERLGVEHVVTVASGTDALTLGLRAVGVGPGDEVVIPAFTFFATAEAVLRAGAEPVFADVRPATFDLDPDAADRAVTGRTAALLPVHLFGQMADMEALAETADRHGLAVVEDAAQAMGAARVGGGGGGAPGGGSTAGDSSAEDAPPAAAGPPPEPDVAGRAPGAGGSAAAGRADDGSPGGGRADRRWTRAGTAGDVGCFSFYPTKNLAAMGDGGAVATDDGETAGRLRRLRDHGRDPDRGGRHGEVAWNSRLDELQAAVLRAKLGRLEEWNARRRRHARAYDRALSELDGLVPPPVRPGCRHVYHQYTLRCDDRDALARALSKRGIGHGVYYPVPLNREPAFAEAEGGAAGGPAVTVRVAGDLSGAERAADEVLSLPVFPLLEDEERDRVIGALRAFAE